jgi:hypothetical protein
VAILTLDFSGFACFVSKENIARYKTLRFCLKTKTEALQKDLSTSI